MTKAQELSIAQEKGELLQKAVNILDKLASNGLADIDGDEVDDNTLELKDLIIKARGLKSNHWWSHIVKK